MIRTNTILDEFIFRNFLILQASKQKLAMQTIRKQAESIDKESHQFLRNLAQKKSKSTLGLIAEIKKSSPSAGIINLEVNVKQLAKLYEDSGASAISVLTQPFKFNGSLDDLETVAHTVSLPVVRKDFIFDPYQIYEAKVTGAGAILLIVTSLEKPLLKDLFELAHSIGLDVLMETHDEHELEIALDCRAKIIGVNARNLQTMTTDLATAEQVLPLVPKDKIRVAESGILNTEDIKKVRAVGADAILVGSTIMSSKNPKEKIKEFLTL